MIFLSSKLGHVNVFPIQSRHLEGQQNAAIWEQGGYSTWRIIPELCKWLGSWNGHLEGVPQPDPYGDNNDHHGY